MVLLRGLVVLRRPRLGDRVADRGHENEQCDRQRRPLQLLEDPRRPDECRIATCGEREQASDDQEHTEHEIGRQWTETADALVLGAPERPAVPTERSVVRPLIASGDLQRAPHRRPQERAEGREADQREQRVGGHEHGCDVLGAAAFPQPDRRSGGADLVLQAAADRGQAVALRVRLLELPEQVLCLSAAQVHGKSQQTRQRQPLVPARRRRGEPLILRGRSSRLGHGVPIPSATDALELLKESDL